MTSQSSAANKAYVAIDLGAESGRVIVGHHDGETLQLEPVHRFTHAPLRLPSGLHWNLTGIWSGILSGLRRAGDWSRENNTPIRSLGVDAWGVSLKMLTAALAVSGSVIVGAYTFVEKRVLTDPQCVDVSSLKKAT